MVSSTYVASCGATSPSERSTWSGVCPRISPSFWAPRARRSGSDCMVASFSLRSRYSALDKSLGWPIRPQAGNSPRCRAAMGKRQQIEIRGANAGALGGNMFSRYLGISALSVGVAMMSVAGFSAAMAQSYPTQPIKVVIGFGPGSAADILARLVGKRMEVSLGQPIVVENRPGNSSMIAAESVARAPADGYTLFVATIANTLNPAETRSGFNLAKELAPITLLGVVPNVLVAHPSVAASNLAELIALARTKPESLTFASSGYATASYMAAELFNAKAGTNIPMGPYQGGGDQAVSDLLAGRITLMFNVAAALAPHVEAGKLKPFAVAQRKRASIMPAVPTLSEAGTT